MFLHNYVLALEQDFKTNLMHISSGIKDPYLHIVKSAAAMVLQSKIIESEGDPSAVRHSDSPVAYAVMRVQIRVIWR